MPHMLDETPAQLVTHLDHPNGWWRDQAQMLLVLKGDKSVVPALMEMARTDKNPLGQHSRPLDARRPWRARRVAGPRKAEGSRAAGADRRHARQRIARSERAIPR